MNFTLGSVPVQSCGIVPLSGVLPSGNIEAEVKEKKLSYENLYILHH